jgi:glutamine cyclotransferase
VFDRETFLREGAFTYNTEGWGLTNDGSALIMSDGSAWLRFRDPKTFSEIRRVQVRDDKGPVEKLNELEFIKGEVYANIWFEDVIARISPESGQVLGWIDLHELRDRLGSSPSAEVLNGIAYDEEEDRIFVTGKLWPKLFEIKTVERGGQ